MSEQVYLDITWAQAGKLIDKLVKKISLTMIARNELSAKPIKYVYGLPRGGLCIAAALSHKLGIKYIHTIDEFIDVDFQNDGVVLIVDDLSDTGATLIDTINKLEYACIDFETATLHIKKDTAYIPDSVADDLPKERSVWVRYPWECKDSTNDRTTKPTNR